jgi:phosphoribosyl-dephospho-CoA transferase
MFARHDLVWLSDRGWQRARATLPATCHGAIDIWRQARWPAIVRRADAGQLPGQLSIGIALPPGRAGGAKTRIGFRVPASDIDKVLPPLSIAQVIDAVPASWGPLLATLERQATGRGLAIRVYGSVALQALTREPYLTAASDIDVLLHPVTRAQLYRGLDLLSFHASALPLDGEIVFPGAQAVAWKELSGALSAAGGSRVLVKEIHGVSLATASALLATMQDDICMG